MVCGMTQGPGANAAKLLTLGAANAPVTLSMRATADTGPEANTSMRLFPIEEPTTAGNHDLRVQNAHDIARHSTY